ncbi:angiopoietin-related protein 1-like [Drosophila takahashii]|uniref:angiopoietin-related protein 1-like n=1 Tax=Drosophila takahashii TaxID=29030 RepID=UPI001CF8DACD|nr:angiopoietin-related protein 1-like [Drosophila takahashii]
MTEIIRNLQTQLVNAEAQLKINDKEIIDKSEQLKQNEDQIKDQTNQIQNKDEELVIKTNAVKDLSAQISTKDNQINGLNNQIKSVSEDLERSKKYFGSDECPKSGPSGIYVLKVPGNVLMEVPCNSTGWIVVLRRQDGSVDFQRRWMEYKDGFGNLTGEFFIGLEKLHQLTKGRSYHLYIKLVDVHGSVVYAQYDNFKVSNEENKYRLDSVGKYSGTAGDSLAYNADEYFTTIDRDNDANSGNCAISYSGGGWWYSSCSFSFLTGKFYKDGISPDYGGINWHYYRNDETTSFTYVEMLIKPK